MRNVHILKLEAVAPRSYSLLGYLAAHLFIYSCCMLHVAVNEIIRSKYGITGQCKVYISSFGRYRYMYVGCSRYFALHNTIDLIDL